MRSFIAMAVPLAAFFLAGAVQVLMRRSPSNRSSLAVGTAEGKDSLLRGQRLS